MAPYSLDCGIPRHSLKLYATEKVISHNIAYSSWQFY